MLIVSYGEYPCDHFRSEIRKADVDIANSKKPGKTMRSTGSEHYILRLLQAVRGGVLSTDDLTIYYHNTVIEVDINGDFIQPWPDNLFEADFYLRFTDYETSTEDPY